MVVLGTSWIISISGSATSGTKSLTPKFGVFRIGPRKPKSGSVTTKSLTSKFGVFCKMANIPSLSWGPKGGTSGSKLSSIPLGL